jgi:hypothetical protein
MPKERGAGMTGKTSDAGVWVIEEVFDLFEGASLDSSKCACPKSVYRGHHLQANAGAAQLPLYVDVI